MESIDRSALSGCAPSQEVAAAIAIAIEKALGEEVHDMESYIITIKRRHQSK